MLLSDVEKVLGDRPLSEFPWGCVVRDTVNLFAREDLKLTLASTGADLVKALDAMPESNRILLNSAQLDARRSCVVTPIGGGLVVEHPGESNVSTDGPSLFTGLNLATMFVVVNVLLIAMLLFSTTAAGHDVDWSELGALGKDVLKTIAGF